MTGSIGYFVTGDPSVLLPLVDRDFDGVVDQDDLEIVTPATAAANDTGPGDVAVTAVFVAAKGQIRLQNTPQLVTGDRFILRLATSWRSATTVKVEGDSCEMVLSVTESITTGGTFLNSFVISDEATINIGDVVHEQHVVAAGLLADRATPSEQHLVASNLVVGDTFNVTLTSAPVDIDGDGAGGVSRADVATGGAVAASLDIDAAYAGGTSLPMVGIEVANIDDRFTLTYGKAVAAETATIRSKIRAYNTGDLFEVDLENIPLDRDDDGALDVDDIEIDTRGAGALGVNVATVTAGDTTVSFVVTTGGAGTTGGGTFTLNYNGQVIQNVTIPATGLQANETQDIVLNNPPLRDANDDDLVNSADITVNLSTISVAPLGVGGIPSGDDGSVTIRNTSLNAIQVDAPFAVAYRGQFSITLSHAPIQGTPTTADITAAIVVPAFGVPGNLYQVNEVDADTGLVRFGVLADTPATRTVLGISYAGSEQHTPPGVAQNTGDEF